MEEWGYHQRPLPGFDFQAVRCEADVSVFGRENNNEMAGNYYQRNHSTRAHGENRRYETTSLRRSWRGQYEELCFLFTSPLLPTHTPRRNGPKMKHRERRVTKLGDDDDDDDVVVAASLLAYSGYRSVAQLMHLCPFLQFVWQAV